MSKKVFLKFHDSETDLFLILTGYKSPGKRTLGITTGGWHIFGEKITEHLYEPGDYQKIRVTLEGFHALLAQWRGTPVKKVSKEIPVTNDKNNPSVLTLSRTETGVMAFTVTQNGRNFTYAARQVPRILGAVKDAIAWLSKP